MMQYDRITLGRKARELGFVRDTFEKVCRLVDVLSFINTDSLLSSCLALKGGTAINLTIFGLPRLSVDIDLDFTENLPRDKMLSVRGKVTDHIEKYIESLGYKPSVKSKKSHALDSFVYEYQNSGGTKDNLKIEINYMLRCHVLPESRRKVNLPWDKSELTVLSIAPIEIFASKIVALLNRTALRDLYDIHYMLHHDLFNESEQTMLRKCTLLYRVIGSKTVPDRFRFDVIEKISTHQIKTELLPVLRRSEHFDLRLAQSKTVQYLSELLTPNETEWAFLEAFRRNAYRPELLFDQVDVLERISHHPMALWKCNGQNTITWDC